MVQHPEIDIDKYGQVWQRTYGNTEDWWYLNHQQGASAPLWREDIQGKSNYMELCWSQAWPSGSFWGGSHGEKWWPQQSSPFISCVQHVLLEEHQQQKRETNCHQICWGCSGFRLHLLGNGCRSFNVSTTMLVRNPNKETFPFLHSFHLLSTTPLWCTACHCFCVPQKIDMVSHITNGLKQLVQTSRVSLLPPLKSGRKHMRSFHWSKLPNIYDRYSYSTLSHYFHKNKQGPYDPTSLLHWNTWTIHAPHFPAVAIIPIYPIPFLCESPDHTDPLLQSSHQSSKLPRQHRKQWILQGPSGLWDSGKVPLEIKKNGYLPPPLASSFRNALNIGGAVTRWNPNNFHTNSSQSNLRLENT